MPTSAIPHPLFSTAVLPHIVGNHERAKSHGRPQWDERHHLKWENDLSHPNGRNYFDRYRPRMDRPVYPRPRLRPVWVLDVPTKELDNYRVFHAPTASWKDLQWKGFPLKEAEVQAPAPDQNLKDAYEMLPSGELLPKSLTPRTGQHLEHVRDKEADWNSHHDMVFSRYNEERQPDTRSYFDRWKEEDGPEVRSPTWRLREPRLRPLGQSNSNPQLQLRHSEPVRGKPQWKGNHFQAAPIPWDSKRKFKGVVLL
mmetsp:Transcript_3286/g.4074  ORF Transcript_3286/g.4074 Transcript_3286/m.4074 type:complete len:254 (-) Transcript_3286:49-810(-)